MNKKSILVVGVDEPVGRELALHFHAQGHDVLGVIKCYRSEHEELLFPLVMADYEDSLDVGKKFDIIIQAEGYKFAGEIAKYQQLNNSNDNATNRMVNVAGLALKQGARVIHISSTHLYGNNIRDINGNLYGEIKLKEEKILEVSEVDFVSLRVPELIAKAFAQCLLLDIINKALENKDIEVTTLDDSVDMLWFQDLIYFIEWIFGQSECLKHDYTLTSHFKYPMRSLLLEIGKITNASSNVILSENQNEENLLVQDSVWRELSWCTTADIDMVRKLLPVKLVRQYGRVPIIVEYMQNYDKIALEMYGYLLNFAHKEGDYAGAYATVYQALKQKYQKFIFEIFDCTGISYMNFNVYLYTLEEKRDNALHIFLPITVDGKPFDASKIPNKWLWQHLQMKREIVDENNAGFWQYVVKEHFADVQFSVDYYNLLVQEREMNFQYKPLFRDSIIKFTAEENRQAENAMREMGLAGKEYVCIFSRDGVYEKEKYKDTERSAFAIEHDYTRNSSVENYRLMIDNLAAKDIYTVRMGAVCEHSFVANKTVDYATNYRTEMMDYYLLSHARYFVCTCSGIFSIAMLFGTPLVWVNNVQFSILRDNKPILNPMRDLQIPKKIWNAKEKRYLTLREMLEFERTHPDIDIMSEYLRQDMEFKENTPEEINALVEEMEARLAGTKEYTAEEIALQDKFFLILREGIDNIYYHPFDARMGTQFLLDNPWFLE